MLLEAELWQANRLGSRCQAPKACPAVCLAISAFVGINEMEQEAHRDVTVVWLL